MRWGGIVGEGGVGWWGKFSTCASVVTAVAVTVTKAVASLAMTPL